MPSAQTTRTPEKKIEQTKNSLKASTKTPFMFPLDVTSSFVYMHIVPHKIKVGEILKGVSVSYDSAGGEQGQGSSSTGDAEGTLRGLGGGDRAVPRVENKTITERSIILPIPEKLADKLSISYNASSLGVSAAMFMAGQSLGSLSTDSAADVKSASAYAARQMLSAASQELGDIFALSSQSVPNPYSTLMFKQVEQRSFDFSYTFAPTSEKETEAIKKIVNALRYLSLPAEDDFFLDFPYEFEISFAGSNYLYAFSRGYITDLAVEFGGDGGVSFFDTTSGRGAAPSIVKLAFTFKEIYPLSRTVIDQGSESMKVDSVFFAEEQKRQAERESPGATEEETERQKQGTEQANKEEARKYSGLDCVCIDSIVFDGRTASEVEVGNELDTIDPITKEFKKQIVTRSETKLSDCVRITTESGIQLDCSISAPISDEHGNQVLAPNLCGIMIPVIDNEEHKLERVVSVEEIGMKKVRHITVNDSFFPAGKEANRYILHHNKQ